MEAFVIPAGPGGLQRGVADMVISPSFRQFRNWDISVNCGSAYTKRLTHFY